VYFDGHPDKTWSRRCRGGIKMTNGAAQTTSPLRILGIAGSLRAGSYNRALLRAAQQLAPQGIAIVTFDLDAIPPYNADVEAQGFPAPVVAFKAAIAGADALLIATPEYNHSIPGVLKNALDWASRPPKQSPLDGKPAAIMGASTGAIGTARAQQHLRLVGAYVNMLVLNQPEVLVGRAQDKFDASGRLTDEPTRQFLVKFLQAFVQWVARVGAGAGDRRG
jgi:chromate reductase